MIYWLVRGEWHTIRVDSVFGRPQLFIHPPVGCLEMRCRSVPSVENK